MSARWNPPLKAEIEIGPTATILWGLRDCRREANGEEGRFIWASWGPSGLAGMLPCVMLSPEKLPKQRRTFVRRLIANTAVSMGWRARRCATAWIATDEPFHTSASKHSFRRLKSLEARLSVARKAVSKIPGADRDRERPRSQNPNLPAFTTIRNRSGKGRQAPDGLAGCLASCHFKLAAPAAISHRAGIGEPPCYRSARFCVASRRICFHRQLVTHSGDQRPASLVSISPTKCRVLKVYPPE